MPFSAINIHAPKYLKKALVQCPRVGELYGNFYNGHTIKSDVFKRLWWELSPNEAVFYRRMWNGSDYSPLAISMQEVVIWKGYAGGLERHSSTIIRSPKKHLLPGLCYGKRGDYLDVQILTEGNVLTNEGFGGPFPDKDSTWYLLGYLNSLPVQRALNFYCGQHKGVGYVNSLPIPSFSTGNPEQISSLTKRLYTQLRKAQITLENDPLFICVWGGAFKKPIEKIGELQNWYVSEEEKLRSDFEELNLQTVELLALDDIEKTELIAETRLRPLPKLYWWVRSDFDLPYHFSFGIISYVWGCILGRWDVRYSTCEIPFPELPDPFAPLPICPPGMLLNTKGLPAAVQDVPSSYPLCISWSGILVDDEGHLEDLEKRVREALLAIWQGHAEAIEQETCQILGVRSLREYFHKSALFFGDHLKRYTKSRRQAPIYWPLSTTSCSYTLWLYYHRLTDQTLFKCVNDFVDPKLEQVREEAARLRQKKGRSAGDETELERLTDFESELKDFRGELLRVAKFWKPNLNDGVEITAAPLWKLFQHKPWQKRLKETWQKLEAGEYDWAHLAYSIWPERVREKCKTDKSLAISHELEELYIEPKNLPKKKKDKTKADLEMDGMFEDES